MIRSAIAKLAATKVVAGAALATAATGGIALAAASGSLPFQAGHPAAPPTIAHRSDAPTDQPSSGGAPTTGGDSTEAAPANPEQPSSSVPSGTPSPSLVGLCHAFQAGAMGHGNVAQTPAFTALITAAGGADKVAAYCVTLIGPAPTHPNGRPSDLPSHPGAPSTHPAGPPGILPTHPVEHSTHPAGPPTSVPPVSHPAPPSGRP